MKRIKIYGLLGIILITMTACDININTDKCEKKECNCETDIKTVRTNNIVGKEFTRTYMIYNVAQSNDYDYLYLTIRAFQDEEIETVKVKRKDFDNYKEDVYYEITFKITSNEIEDNLKSIFKNSEIIKANQTDKTGLEQVFEDFE